ncbi:reverse transcriptase family protein [Psychromonas antarctica]|uniref:reverse transcriptase family protein n=1 Tax=Psychromonas antarctica TaxID=67573 RepID=UPI001EE8CB8E|nr:reverse transcriptase family protein [Psychromonas antarctica]MCG6202889.1 reverse transcriptase family protein [Psychromonas antarctica]
MPRKKYKINTNDKAYSFESSSFYKLSSPNILANLLHIPLADLKKLKNSKDSYKPFVIKKEGKKDRTIECPKRLLEKVHTRIASLLCRIITPDFLHSGIKGRTYITNAKSHLGKHKVLTSDLRSFYPSTSKKMIFKLFRYNFHCSVEVADLIASVATYEEHLPTGSRLSMPLALWANIEMFLEIESLAKKHSINMTIYVDDLVFSGKNLNELFSSTVNKIVLKHGHEIHSGKTVLYKSDEIKLITGVIVHNDEIFIRNCHHQNMHNDLEEWKTYKNGFMVPDDLKSRLLGRINAFAQIDPRLKDKARSILAIEH